MRWKALSKLTLDSSGDAQPNSFGDVVVNLDRCGVTDDELRAMLSPLDSNEFKRHLPHITFLDLDNNQLTTLPECIGAMTSLKGLRLENNQLTAQARAVVQRLKARRGNALTVSE